MIRAIKLSGKWKEWAANLSAIDDVFWLYSVYFLYFSMISSNWGSWL